jgi:hypothetical protein
MKKHPLPHSAALIVLLAALCLAPSFACADGMDEQPPGVKNPAPQTTAAKTAPKKNKKGPAEKGGKSKKAAPAAPTAAPTAKPASGNTAPLSDFELGRYQYCGKDADCVVSINGCCDCANGGMEVAVNKERLEDFRKRFECLYVECGRKPANPPCANGVVSCIEHKCKYFDDAKR